MPEHASAKAPSGNLLFVKLLFGNLLFVKLMFGKETAGLPEWLREKYRSRCIRIPMAGPVRSLNLANSVAVLCYEALRQQGFPDLKTTGLMSER